MGTLSDLLGPVPGESPFSRGRRAAKEGRKAPDYPSTNASWSQKLYFRGFQAETFRSASCNEKGQRS